MDYLKQNHLSIVALVILGLMFLMGGSKLELGALDRTTVGNPWTFTGAVTHSGTLTQTGAATFTADATFNGGDGGIVVTSSNSATSSVTVGCIETYATSTATTVRLQLGTGNAISTTTSRDASAATTGGVVYWFYGTCP